MGSSSSSSGEACRGKEAERGRENVPASSSGTNSNLTYRKHYKVLGFTLLLVIVVCNCMIKAP